MIDHLIISYVKENVSMNKKINNKGFSLVELIVVIAIMAVLIGVLAPQFIKYVEKSRQSTDITNLDSCVSAVKVYYTDHDMPSGGVTITGSKGNNFTATPNTALTNVGAANTKVKGDWTGSISATVTTSGLVTYTGTSTYYTASGDKFVPND